VTDDQPTLRAPKLEHHPPHGGFWESVANVGRRKTTAIAGFAAGALSREVIDVLAVPNALRAALSPRAIFDR